MSSAAEKYSKAVELYASTAMSLTEISRTTGVARTALAAYILRCHRDLVYRRHGIKPPENLDERLHGNKGQRRTTHEKYREAIQACDSVEFLDYNVSQIARIYGLNGTALGNQLRAHYPDIIPRREAERRRQGLADNIHHGVRDYAMNTYAGAVELLRNSDVTIKEAAERFGVSFTGLRQHLLFYHKDLVKMREKLREAGKENPRIGTVSGNGGIRRADADAEIKYAPAVQLYKTTSLSVKEICRRLNLSTGPFFNYLRLWHRDLMFLRRGAEIPADSTSDRADLTGKRYSRATAEKYAPAIDLLKNSDKSVGAVAKQFGFVAEVFRQYLKEHEPELYERMGMTGLANGSKVLKRSYERYAEAIELYRTTGDSLISISSRLGLPYKSVSGFIHRNCQDAVAEHNKLVEASQKEEAMAKQLQNEAREREKIIDEKNQIITALQKTNNNRRAAAVLLGMSKSTLYNKINSFGIK